MSFLAVHRDASLALATDDPLLAPAQVRPFTDALALAATLRGLRDSEAQRIEIAVAAGRAQGHAEGLAQGLADAHEAAAESLADTLAQLLADARREEAELRAAVLSLALLVVRRVASTLERDAVLAALVSDALQRVLALDARGRDARAAPCVLSLHPQLLGAVRQRIEARHPGLGVEWRGDATLAALDCVIETAAGRVLAGLEAQLEHIRAVLQALPPAASAAEAEPAFALQEADS